MRLFGSMPNTTHPARSKTAAVRGASLPLQCIYGYLRPRRSGNARRGQSSGRGGHIGSCSGPGVPAYRCGPWPRRSPPRRPCRGARADRDGDSARGRRVRAPSFRRWAAASAADRRAAGRIRGPDRRRSAGRKRRGCPGGDGLPCQEPDEGRLVGAVRADQAVDAARLQRQSEVVEDRPAGNLEADALELEKRRPPDAAPFVFCRPVGRHQKLKCAFNSPLRPSPYRQRYRADLRSLAGSPGAAIGGG